METQRIDNHPHCVEATSFRYVLKLKRYEDRKTVKGKVVMVICGDADDVCMWPYCFGGKLEVISSMTVAALRNGSEVLRIDFGNAFLNDPLDRKLYMPVPTHIGRTYA